MENIDFEVIEDTSKDVDAIRFYLEDEFFNELENFLRLEDYALAKDALKGLYILALEFKLFKLYESLLEIYEDLEAEEYKEVMNHYEVMKQEHLRLKEEYSYDA